MQPLEKTVVGAQDFLLLPEGVFVTDKGSVDGALEPIAARAKHCATVAASQHLARLMKRVSVRTQRHFLLDNIVEDVPAAPCFFDLLEAALRAPCPWLFRDTRAGCPSERGSIRRVVNT